MRPLVVLAALATAACSSGSPDSGTAANQAASSRAPDADSRLLEPKTSPAARDARALVIRYYDLIKERKYADARKLWGHDGADAGGDTRAFAAAFARYSLYQPTVGEPTDIHVTGGEQYVNIAVKLRAKLKKGGRIVEQEGPVMLRRPVADESGGRGWSIWGVDIRSAH